MAARGSKLGFLLALVRRREIEFFAIFGHSAPSEYDTLQSEPLGHGLVGERLAFVCGEVVIFALG
ncbi:hypothetical protein A7P98_00260 [Eikenella sp. NML080894]|nr:hypothetical protein A7P98_00260 [Eikenella sp. NML080894]